MLRSALVAYEHLLTVEDEYTLVLSRKWTATTWIFLVNRYVLIFGAIMDNLSSTVSLFCCGESMNIY